MQVLFYMQVLFQVQSWVLFFLHNYLIIDIAMASKTTLIPDDPKQTSTDSKEIDFSPQDIAANQLSSIIDAVPRLSLES